jgi:hypothetical protein
MHVKFLLVSLESRSRVGGRENVALNEVGTFGSRIEAFLELVGCALTLKFESFSLESSAGVARQ